MRASCFQAIKACNDQMLLLQGAEVFRAAKALRTAPPPQQRPAPGKQRQRGIAFGTGVGDEDDTYGMVRNHSRHEIVANIHCSLIPAIPPSLRSASWCPEFPGALCSVCGCKSLQVDDYVSHEPVMRRSALHTQVAGSDEDEDGPRLLLGGR